MAKRPRDIRPDLIDNKKQFSDKKKLLIAHLDNFVRNQIFPTDTILCALLRDQSQVELWNRRDRAGLSSIECFRPLTQKIMNDRKDLSDVFKLVNKDSYDYFFWSSSMRWQSTSDETLEIWCGFSVKSGVIGPFFMDEISIEERPNHPLKNKSRYFKLIEDYVVPEFKRKELNIADFHFQQDSDAIAIKDLEYLESLFAKVYSPGCSPNKWPLNSPDLSPVEFCIWDRFRGLLALELPQTTDEVKYWAKAFLSRVSPDHHVHAIREFKVRVWLCNKVKGLDFKSELQRQNSSMQAGKLCSYCLEIHECSCDGCRKRCFFRNKCNDDNFREPFDIMDYVKDCQSRQMSPFDFNR